MRIDELKPPVNDLSPVPVVASEQVSRHVENCRSAVETLADDPLNRSELAARTDPHRTLPERFVG